MNLTIDLHKLNFVLHRPCRCGCNCVFDHFISNPRTIYTFKYII